MLEECRCGRTSTRWRSERHTLRNLDARERLNGVRGSVSDAVRLSTLRVQLRVRNRSTTDGDLTLQVTGQISDDLLDNLLIEDFTLEFP